MRGRHDDADLWGGLRARGGRPEGASRRAALGSSLPPEARGRLLDATLGLLASIRTMVEVAEEVLEERRERLVHGGGPSPWVRGPEDARRRPAEPAPDDEGVVRDIPFSSP